MCKGIYVKGIYVYMREPLLFFVFLYECESLIKLWGHIVSGSPCGD